jgi:hypothetical protein
MDVLLIIFIIFAVICVISFVSFWTVIFMHKELPYIFGSAAAVIVSAFIAGGCAIVAGKKED